MKLFKLPEFDSAYSLSDRAFFLSLDAILLLAACSAVLFALDIMERADGLLVLL